MNHMTALRLDRDRDPTADIVPEAYFRCVAVRELEFPSPETAVERQLTEARAAWTEKFLYVHLWFKDGWITKDDTVEVAFQPEVGINRVVGWKISALGDVWALDEGGLKAKDRSRTGPLVKVRRHDAGWVVELKLSFLKDLIAQPRTGDSWGLTLHRTDVDRRNRVTHSTFSSDVVGGDESGFRDPRNFGRLLFG